MNLVDRIPVGARVGVDTASFIYWVENHPTYVPVLNALFADRFGQGLNAAVTTTVSLAEVLVKPLRLSRSDLVSDYQDFFAKEPYLTLVSISPAVAERAADLRARYGIRLPDALQLAGALEGGATVFVANDNGLRRVTELLVLILDDYLPSTIP